MAFTAAAAGLEKTGDVLELRIFADGLRPWKGQVDTGLSEIVIRIPLGGGLEWPILVDRAVDGPRRRARSTVDGRFDPNIDPMSDPDGDGIWGEDGDDLDVADRWILSRLASTAARTAARSS